MGFSIELGVPVLTVFLQGILSFISPCVLPLVPLYIGYLAGGTKTVDEDGVIHYQRKKVLINTIFFVIGVSFAFFLLGFGFTAAGKFFSSNRMMFARIGGIIVILFGLYQLGIFGSGLFQKELRLPVRLNSLAMNPFLALLMGFTFSFAWTPCVGPALASVLLMASSANSSAAGFVLIGVYTLGFTLPFLAVGFFTGSMLDFFKKHQQIVKYTVKAGGVLMVLMGIMMWGGWMNGITGYLSQSGLSKGNNQIQESGPIAGGSEKDSDSDSPAGESRKAAESAAVETETDTAAEDTAKAEERPIIPAPDFTLKDQFGTEHTLSDYKGKVVFLNFWATWCGPCRMEMPDIQALYEEYGKNSEDLVVLGVAMPKSEKRKSTQEGTQEDVAEFLANNGYTYPTVMDLDGAAEAAYGISAFPTTFMIDKEGNVFGYVPGALTKEIMEDIIQQTMQGKSTAE